MGRFGATFERGDLLSQWLGATSIHESHQCYTPTRRGWGVTANLRSEVWRSTGWCWRVRGCAEGSRGRPPSPPRSSSARYLAGQHRLVGLAPVARPDPRSREYDVKSLGCAGTVLRFHRNSRAARLTTCVAQAKATPSFPLRSRYPSCGTPTLRCTSRNLRQPHLF